MRRADKNVVERGDFDRPLGLDRQELGYAASFVAEQFAFFDNGQLVSDQRFDARIERAGFLGRLDTRFDQAKEFVEDGVLHGDRQRQNAVEPALDRRQTLDQRTFVFKLEACPVAERFEAGRCQLAGVEQAIPLGQAFTCVFALQVCDVKSLK